MQDIDSYLICSTPRTGSTLLCALLNSTGIAGHPESYFRKPDMKAWAKKWNITVSVDGDFNYADYLKATLVAGKTENGIFAARIMWGTMDEVIKDLGGIYPELANNECDLLQKAFGRIRFVYLQRDDVISQAVSWLRAEQTDVWHKTASSQTKAEIEPQYNFDELDKLVRTINEHNRSWIEWFKIMSVGPYLITYEQLDSEPTQTVQKLMTFLGLDLPANQELTVSNERLADDTSLQWAEKYRAELAKR